MIKIDAIVIAVVLILSVLAPPCSDRVVLFDFNLDGWLPNLEVNSNDRLCNHNVLLSIPSTSEESRIDERN